MAAFTDYRGLKRWIPAPTGPAGIVLNDNFTELADRSGPIHSAAANPTVNDDDADTAGNGKFYVWSKWLNSGTNDLYICTDATATAAVWIRIHYDTIIDPEISNSLIIDGTQVVYLPDQTDFNRTIIIGNGGTALLHTAGSEGQRNTAVGINAYDAGTTGQKNTAIGAYALEDNTTASWNVAIGDRAICNTIDGHSNIGIGVGTLHDNTTGDQNVAIGYQAGYNILGDGNICIGDKAGFNEAGSNKLYIENSNSATPLIYGEFDNDLVKINGDLYIPSDTKKLYLGADATDYTIAWDGNDAVHTITAGDFTFIGGNVGINESAPQDKLEVNGTGLFKGRIKLTQDDGNEYIEGVNDNYLDIGATTAIRNNAAVLMTDKVMFTQVDGDEYIDSLADGFMDYGATTAHRFLNDIKITQDNDKLYFGIADDVSITYTGTKWVFDIEAATDLITMNPDGDDTDFVFGSSQLNDTGTAAQDAKFFFDKGKGAFRAGKVTSTSWDAGSVGNYSMALGYNNTASATSSISIGSSTTASSENSIAMGTGTIASALAAVAIGNGTTASGIVAVALGLQSSSNKRGQISQAAGQFGAIGDAQGSTLISRKSVVHSDAAWYELFLDGVDDQLTLASNTVWTFDILIVGTTSGCTKSFGFKITGVIENDGGTTTILASNVTTLYDADDTDFDARVTADDATDALKIEVTDATSGGDTVRWVAKISIVEVTY